jgi:hypothetical protein
VIGGGTDLLGRFDAAGRRVFALMRDARIDVLQRLDAVLARIAPQQDQLFDSIHEILLVASSSRSGSSLLVEMLKCSVGFLHTAGEINPYLRLAGLTWPDLPSDALSSADASPGAMAMLRRLLALDIEFAGAYGRNDWTADDLSGSSYMARVCCRLCLQWPLLPITIEEIEECILRVLSAGRGGTKPSTHRWCLAEFYAQLLQQLRSAYPEINPYYYDIDQAILRRYFPDIPVPSGPPSPCILEEPPFVLVRPTSRVPRRGPYTLVIKAPSNAYRLDFLTRLFPDARPRLLQLTRNPASAINGIYDGWLYRGFHSYFVGHDLRIGGYSEEGRPDFGWWKFDLPPGWEARRNASLVETAAFQWTAAHRAIFRYAGSRNIEYRRIRHEDVVTGFANDVHSLRNIRDWLGDDLFPRVTADKIHPVMMTQPPRRGRWREKAHILRDGLNDGSVLEVAQELGYDNPENWT